MESRHLSLPKQQNYEYDYELAYKFASEQLAKFDNTGIGQQYLKSGARCQGRDSQEIITLEYLNQSYQIVFPDIDISLTDGKEEPPSVIVNSLSSYAQPLSLIASATRATATI